ncbi:Helix-turn-helix [Dyadobacter koreensis]|uniref:Helix-turn-helix n=1 Tax=Dyadobacter koreensis TaxID=408657 RepID=A0A1H6THL0_9BACT|nr:helix-turn-helix transcriptional regulator [Dyadobacter koreensis]SEI79559.1 Helix-turn-helix [Dyadobacter koreensis]
MNVAVETRIKTVAANIRKVREYRDYTQEYLAMKLGISQNAYSKIELAYTRITLERLIQIAAILDIDVITLINSTSEDLLKLNTSTVPNGELMKN